MLALAFSAVLLTSSAAQLATNSPLQQQEATIMQMDCIMQRLGQPYQLLALPWLRAKREVRLNRVDGYFTAILLQEMESFGQLSAPLYLENWYWIEHRTTLSLPQTAKRYGVVRGSHQAKWFEQMQIQAAAEVNTNEELVRMLQLKRVDLILMDLEVFEQTAAALEVVRQDLSIRFFRYVPLGVYFSNQFLQQRPRFLKQFNQFIPVCSSGAFNLSVREQQIILETFLAEARKLAKHPRIQQALHKKNAEPWLTDQIKQHDQQWQNEVKQGQPLLADAMLDSELSRWLRDWQQTFSGRIAEVILMDAQGRNVAISAVTSDYWQGDEIKYLQVFGLPEGILLDNVRFDASTQRFLVQLNVAVDSNQGKPLGAITLGLDVELSLQYCQQNVGNPDDCAD